MIIQKSLKPIKEIKVHNLEIKEDFCSIFLFVIVINWKSLFKKLKPIIKFFCIKNEKKRLWQKVT